jgi:hypothetical protein
MRLGEGSPWQNQYYNSGLLSHYRFIKERSERSFLALTFCKSLCEQRRASDLWEGKISTARYQWFMPIILATWEDEFRRILVWGQFGQIVHETPSPITTAKWNGGMTHTAECLLHKHKALSSNPCPIKKTKQNKLWVGNKEIQEPYQFLFLKKWAPIDSKFHLLKLILIIQMRQELYITMSVYNFKKLKIIYISNCKELSN